MIPLEKYPFFKRTVLSGFPIQVYKHIVALKTQSLIRHKIYENYGIEEIKKVEH